MAGPDGVDRDTVDVGPSGRLTTVPAVAEFGVEQVLQVGAGPRASVHTVGDRGDRVAAGNHREQSTADLTVKLRNTVRPRRDVQAQGRHVEHLGAVVRIGAERRYVVDRVTPGIGPRSQVRIDQRTREAVDTGRHRRVGGEQNVRLDLLDGLCKRGGTAGSAGVIEQRQREESGVALVRVIHTRLPTDRRHGTRPADAEHEFLFEAMQLVAAVEAVGDPSVRNRVDGQVGVEQQQRNPADVEPPHSGGYEPVGDRDLDHDARVDAAEVGRGIRFDSLGLLAVLEQLTEEPVAVEQPDTGQRGAQVAGRLEVVTRQDPQPAGVLRHDFADPEFWREVDDVGARDGRLHGLAEPGELAGNTGDEVAVIEQDVELVVIESLDGEHRMAVGVGRRQRREQVGRAKMPCPKVI